MLAQRDRMRLNDANAVEARLLAADRQRIWRAQCRAAATRDLADRRWFVVRVRRNREKTVEEIFDRNDIQAFVPMVDPPAKRCGKRRIQRPAVPAFDGYVFVCIPVDNRAFVGVLSFDDVRGMVGNDHGPLAVPTQNMERFQSLIESNLLSGNAERRRKRFIQPGESGVITDGPLVWQKAFVRKWRNKTANGDPTRYLVQLLGTDMMAVVDIDTIEKIT